ncbi:MAG: hypothetical protein JSW50_06455, partial [Candidatus Latescibacterota bacterium]
GTPDTGETVRHEMPTDAVDEVLGIDAEMDLDRTEESEPVGSDDGFFGETIEDAFAEDEPVGGAMSWADDGGSAAEEGREATVWDEADTAVPVDRDSEPVGWPDHDLEAEPADELATSEDTAAPVESPAEPSEDRVEPAPVQPPKSVDHWGEEEVGDGVFVDFSAGSQRVDVGSAVDDDRLTEDERLRDLGWSQYGKRLRKIVDREKARRRRKKDDDES